MNERKKAQELADRMRTFHKECVRARKELEQMGFVCRVTPDETGITIARNVVETL